MTSFAHIINPVTEQESKNLFQAQIITFKSILAAKAYYDEPAAITNFTINEHLHNDFIPAGFTQLPPLKRNITNKIPGEKKTLPFLNDILSSLYNNTTADYLIYTNIDIALMPYLYTVAEQYIAAGHDAIVINRRRIKNHFISDSTLEMMYAETGGSHTGYDCFIFKRSLFPFFIMPDICIGAPPTGNDLFHNLFAFAEKPILLADKHLTFHIGMELHNDWANKKIISYNQQQYRGMIQQLYPFFSADKFPWSHKNLISRHLIWLMNPTLHYPIMLRLDAKRKFKKTIKPSHPYKPNIKNRYLAFLAKHFYYN